MSAIGVRIADTARKHVGSKDWAYSKVKGEFGKNTNKCNKFVYDVAVEAGCNPPPTVPKYWVLSRPPLAREWADPGTEISGWVTVASPEPGDVAAIAKEYSDATGHVAIVIKKGQTASATADQVVLNDWGFRQGQNPTFKRYRGTISRSSSGIDWSKKGCCFPAETLIHAPGGPRSIAAISAGDVVLAFDVQRERVEAVPVLRREEHVGQYGLRAFVMRRQQPLTVTARHRFSLAGGRWVPSEEIESGRILASIEGPESVQGVELSRKPVERVYNLRVARCHNYFVGHQGLLVRDH